MYAYTYVQMYVLCMYVLTCVWACVSVYVPARARVCVYVRMNICMYICVCVNCLLKITTMRYVPEKKE